MGRGNPAHLWERGMNLKTRPLLVASSTGAAVELVVALITQGLAYFTLFKPFSAQSSFSQVATGTGLVRCLCGLFVAICVGALYTLVYPHSEPFTASNGAIGGATAATIARTISGVLGLCIVSLLIPMALPQFLSEGLPSDFLGLRVETVTSLVFSVIALVFTIVVAAVLGAVGGAVATALRGNSLNSEILGGTGLS